MVETSTYSVPLMAGKTATELILECWHLIRMMETNLDGPAMLLGNDNSVVLNCTMPSSVLKKKHSAVAHYRIRETIAVGIVKFSHVPSGHNYANILTKPVQGLQF